MWIHQNTIKDGNGCLCMGVFFILTMSVDVSVHLDHTLLTSIFGHHMLQEKAKLMW